MAEPMTAALFRCVVREVTVIFAAGGGRRVARA